MCRTPTTRHYYTELNSVVMPFFFFCCSEHGETVTRSTYLFSRYRRTIIATYIHASLFFSFLFFAMISYNSHTTQTLLPLFSPTLDTRGLTTSIQQLLASPQSFKECIRSLLQLSIGLYKSQWLAKSAKLNIVIYNEQKPETFFFHTTPHTIHKQSSWTHPCPWL